MQISCSKRFVLAGTALLLASGLLTSSASAQRTEREQTLFVSAASDDGEPLLELGVDDVTVREDGRVREVLSVARATEPMDVALLIDTSAASVGQVQNLRRGVLAFINGIEPPLRVALITLAARPTILVDYTANRERLVEAAEGLFPTNGYAGTRLDAIVEVAEGIENRPAPRAAIVALVFEGSEQTRFYAEDVRNAIERSGTTLHAVTVGLFPSAGPEPARSLSEVWESVTRESGGQRVVLRTPSGLDTVMGRVARELSNQHRVTFGRPDSLIPPERLEIESTRPGVMVRGARIRDTADLGN